MLLSLTPFLERFRITIPVASPGKHAIIESSTLKAIPSPDFTAFVLTGEHVPAMNH